MLPKAPAGLALLATTLFSFTTAQLPPAPEGLLQINSSFPSGSSITYKETHICENSPNLTSYSGHIHLPSSNHTQPYPISTYFWYFPSRNSPSTSPLAVWIQGGPGVPSITAALGENGPCSIANDSKTTIHNPWSWNNNVNMLYIDQPVQVGFSYSSLVNGSIDQVNTGPVHVTEKDFGNGSVPENTATKFAGTFARQNAASAPNTTEVSTRQLWEVMQVWMQNFPPTHPRNNKFSLWTESYGGHYGPAVAEYFNSQNNAITAGSLPGAKPLTLDTLGIINGCIDMKVQMPYYPEMAFNNTYDMPAINQTQYEAATQAWPECEAKIDACRSAHDGSQVLAGSNKTVTDTCLDAYMFCFAKMHDMFPEKLLSHFDLTKTIPDDTVPKYAAGYLNTLSTQLALGVPLNFTGESEAIASAFNLTGDFVFGGNLARLSSHLDRGGKLALIYGDADYQCNWLGGEAISLALNASISPEFQSAGYTDLVTNESYVGGMVKQAGHLSFSRVFNAGHEVPYYQPETALKIFERVMGERDVGTGSVCLEENGGYRTQGECDVKGVKNKADKQGKASCYTWDVMETCTMEEHNMLKNGTAEVRDFVLQN